MIYGYSPSNHQDFDCFLLPFMPSLTLRLFRDHFFSPKGFLSGFCNDRNVARVHKNQEQKTTV